MAHRFGRPTRHTPPQTPRAVGSRRLSEWQSGSSTLGSSCVGAPRTQASAESCWRGFTSGVSRRLSNPCHSLPRSSGVRVVSSVSPSCPSRPHSRFDFARKNIVGAPQPWWRRVRCLSGSDLSTRSGAPTFTPLVPKWGSDSRVPARRLMRHT